MKHHVAATPANYALWCTLCRPRDTAVKSIDGFRFGGEEFVILLPNMTLRSARQFAESKRRSIEKLLVRDQCSRRRYPLDSRRAQSFLCSTRRFYHNPQIH